MRKIIEFCDSSRLDELHDFDYRRLFPNLQKLQVNQYRPQLEGPYPSLRELYVFGVGLTAHQMRSIVYNKTPGFLLRANSQGFEDEERIKIAEENRHAVFTY